MDHNHVLTIDGNDITRLPYKQNGIQIFMVSSLFMKVKSLLQKGFCSPIGVLNEDFISMFAKLTTFFSLKKKVCK